MSVYIVKAGNTIKIGYTNQTADSRVATLQTGSPMTIQTLCVFVGANRKFERWLQELVKDDGYHFRGEWFTYQGKIRTIIERCRSDRNAIAMMTYWNLLGKTRRHRLWAVTMRMKSELAFLAMWMKKEGEEWEGFNELVAGFFPVENALINKLAEADERAERQRKKEEAGS